MRKFGHLTIYFSWLMAACGTGDFTTKRQESKYFDINGLVREQMQVLPVTSLLLSKTATVDTDTSRTVSKPDSVHWLQEFQNLTDADINKPRLSDSYTKKTIRPDDTTIVTVYLTLQPARTYVDTLVISERPGELNIKAKIQDKNALFSSAKSLNYHFTRRNGKRIFSTYCIKGWQKMIALDSVHYSIYAKVLNR